MGRSRTRCIAKVTKERVNSLGSDAQPEWTKSLSTAKVKDIMTTAIGETVEAAHIIGNYIDTEQNMRTSKDGVYMFNPFQEKQTQAEFQDAADDVHMINPFK